MNNLAVVYWRAGQLDKSIPLFESLAKLRELQLGRGHPDTLNTLANLGVNYKDAGRLQEALPLLTEAYRASGEIATLRGASWALLDAYVKAVQPAEAANLVQELLVEVRKTAPDGSQKLATELARYGTRLIQATAFSDAEPLLRECLTIRQKQLSSSWSLFDTKTMLGAALAGQRKFGDAEPLLIGGYEGLKRREGKIPPASKARLTEALERLVDLYTAWEKPDEAAKWRKQLEQHKAAQTAAKKP